MKLNLSPDPAGLMLGTGFMRFSDENGVEGLALISEEEINILAVVSVEEGKGCFRKFIAAAKENFDVIRIMEIWNPWLESCLDRYGFIDGLFIGIEGESVKCKIWKKPSPSSGRGDI